MLCGSRKFCGTILFMIILGLDLSMIICPSTNVPLNADHGLLFGIFICALVLSTFGFGK